MEDYLQKLFTRNLLNCITMTFLSVGDAFIAAKTEYGTDSNHLKVNLLGDPALKLSRPKNLISIDNIIHQFLVN